ncbi:MAG: hypothetical protein HKN68_16645 [Saprospiraceae bacterium]|nr:hypothetical protein [Saprospiraceae bacterium]
MEIKPLKNNFCKYLKAKSPYGPVEGGDDPWYLLDQANTICWCIKSSGGAGPDNGLVSPGSCTPGRKCYKAADE